MSTTVTYKGATLTTAENQTRVLKTAGKVMEDDVTIVDVTQGSSTTHVIEILSSNSYSQITISALGINRASFVEGTTYTLDEGDSVTIREVDGGNIYYNDTLVKSDPSATISYTFSMPSYNVKILATNQGSIFINEALAGEVMYEEGLYLGEGSVPTITFNYQHSTPPMFVLISLDTPPFDSTLFTAHMWLYADWNTYYDVDIMPSSSTSYQARIQYMYRNTSTTALSSGVLNLTSTTMSDYVTSTGFTPTAANGVVYSSGCRYSWIAVWPPT